MAQSSARRAEKQRRRAKRQQGRRGPTPPSGAFEYEFTFVEDPAGPDPVADAAEAFDTAARRLIAGMPEGRALAGLVPHWQGDWSATAEAADLVLGSLIAALAEGHWRPEDLIACARRRLEPIGRALLRDAVVTAAGPGGALHTDRAWAREAATLGAALGGRSPSAQRTALEGWGRDQTCRAVAGILADTVHWPRLQDLGVTRSAGGTDTAESAMLAKVRALLAKAESTMFEHEAEAYTAKAQELMARHAIDQALLANPEQATSTSSVRVWIDAPYVTAKSLLLDAVARANRCRSILAGQWGFATVVGESGDVRAVVLLATSLQVQAVRAMARLGSPGRGPGAPSTQAFRQSFLVAFAARIGERLADVESVAQEQVSDRSRLLPVLAARERDIDARFAELFPNAFLKSVVTSSPEGLHAGRAAADLAQLAYGESLEPTA